MSQVRKGQPQELAGFPMMTTSEVVDCLLALGITVHNDDVAKPSAQSAQMIYSALLDALVGAPMELLEQPKAALMGMMEYKVGPPSLERGLMGIGFVCGCVAVHHVLPALVRRFRDARRDEEADVETKVENWHISAGSVISTCPTSPAQTLSGYDKLSAGS